MATENSDPTDVLECQSCDYQKQVRYYVPWDYEDECDQAGCQGTMIPVKLGRCDRCEEPFTREDRQRVAVGDDDGFWFAERDPTEISPGMARVHEDCTENYAEWAAQQVAQ